MSKPNLTYSYVFYYVSYQLAQLVTWSYFTILLLRASNNDIGITFVNYGMLASGIMMGFLLCGFLFHRLGYVGSFRLSNIMNTVVCLFALVTLPAILEVHPIIALLQGIAAGVHWNTVHIFNTKEVHGRDRSKIISIVLSIGAIGSILFPAMVGALITQFNYEWVFVAGAIIYTFAAFYPWSDNKVPRDRLTLDDLRRITLKPGFQRWAMITVSEEILFNLRVLGLAVLPFILIGTEMGVGLLGSAVGLTSAILIFWRRNDSEHRMASMGYLGAGIVTIATTGLVLVWSVPALVIRELTARIGFAVYDPPITYYQYLNRELISGDFKGQLSIEIQQYSEIFLLIARLINVLVLCLVIYVFKVPADLVLKVIIGISVLREFFAMFAHVRLAKSLQKGH